MIEVFITSLRTSLVVSESSTDPHPVAIMVLPFSILLVVRQMGTTLEDAVAAVLILRRAMSLSKVLE